DEPAQEKYRPEVLVAALIMIENDPVFKGPVADEARLLKGKVFDQLHQNIKEHFAKVDDTYIHMLESLPLPVLAGLAGKLPLEIKGHKKVKPLLEQALKAEPVRTDNGFKAANVQAYQNAMQIMPVVSNVLAAASGMDLSGLAAMQKNLQALPEWIKENTQPANLDAVGEILKGKKKDKEVLIGTSTLGENEEISDTDLSEDELSSTSLASSRVVTASTTQDPLTRAALTAVALTRKQLESGEKIIEVPGKIKNSWVTLTTEFLKVLKNIKNNNSEQTAQIKKFIDKYKEVKDNDRLDKWIGLLSTMNDIGISIRNKGDRKSVSDLAIKGIERTKLLAVGMHGQLAIQARVDKVHDLFARLYSKYEGKVLIDTSAS
ncbi:MAG: hypothetical protein WC838_01315, partial [Candidatus Margulisiibacteriota bacterium]